MLEYIIGSAILLIILLILCVKVKRSRPHVVKYRGEAIGELDYCKGEWSGWSSDGGHFEESTTLRAAHNGIVDYHKEEYM